jgi:hypothetical protein
MLVDLRRFAGRPFEGGARVEHVFGEGGDLGDVVVAAVVHAADLAVLGGLEDGL